MGRKVIEKIVIDGESKDVRYHQISLKIKSGVIKSISDIINNKYISRTLLAKELNISPYSFYTKHKINEVDKSEVKQEFLAPDQRKLCAYNFKLSHILILSKLFETSPEKVLKLILNDDYSNLAESS